MTREIVLPSWCSDADLMVRSAQNPEMRFERNADGTLETMVPTGGFSGNRELEAGASLLNWVKSQGLGEVFGPSTGFRLKNKAIRSPDAAFVSTERLPQDWETRENQFLDLAPDFLRDFQLNKYPKLYERGGHPCPPTFETGKDARSTIGQI